ncbi:hypothetical protein GLOTRDRAFT_108932, partial [Gloeophyllum trabeum ATCC 11539]
MCSIPKSAARPWHLICSAAKAPFSASSPASRPKSRTAQSSSSTGFGEPSPIRVPPFPPKPSSSPSPCRWTLSCFFHDGRSPFLGDSRHCHGSRAHPESLRWKRQMTNCFRTRRSHPALSGWKAPSSMDYRLEQ